MISGSATRIVRGYFYLAVIASMCASILTGCSGVRGTSSDPRPDRTSPTAPANLTATATLATQINLSWTASTDNVGVAEYKVERCMGAGCANFAQIATPVSDAFNDAGLSASTAYSYRVRAADAAGNDSAYSNIFSTHTVTAPDTTPPTAPTNFVATAASTTQINLAWTASTDNVGVTGYKVERCSGAACANFVQIATPAGTTFSDTGLTASTSYSYRVRADDAAGNDSAYSNTASATTQTPPDTTPPTAPTNLTATAASTTQINLVWTASTDNVGVTGYKVERCSGAACANFVQIATPAGTTFSDTGLTASTSYSYRVRANDGAGNNSAYSNTASATTQTSPDTTPPTAPTNLTATAASTTQINLSWTASTDNVGVAGYLVERCSGAACANFVQIATPAGTTFSDTGLIASTSYSYRVRADDAAGNDSAYSNTASATTQTPADTTPPTAPTNLTATAASTTQINLTWTASTDNVGVTGYKVERCSGAGCVNFAQIATPAGTTFSDTGLTASTSYSYRVRANDAAGNNSAYSNTASATTQTSPDTTPPTAPTNLTATAASTTQINLSWTASTDNVGVTGYKVERCSGAACANFVQIATPVGTTFNDTGLTASTSYSYRVRANDAAGNNSAYSNTASATTQTSPDTTPPTAPTNLTATAASTTQINLSWTASTDNVGVTGYKVERCSGAACANFVQIATPVGTTFSDTGLTASTSYSYRVRANDAAGNNSAYSNTASATTQTSPDTTPPTAPTNLTATAASTTQINLSWTASTDNVGVTGYKVERCSGAACANFVQIATPVGTTFNDTGLTASTSYSYRVRANDAAGNNSAYSNTASATTQTPPDTTPPTAPTNLTATAASTTQINLSWTTDNVGVAGYLVERCSGAACANFVQIATPAGTTFSDTGLIASTSYSYRVRADDAAGNDSAYSNTASATTQTPADTTPPTAPTNLTATAASTTQINLTWTASTDNVGVTGYKVERCSGAACANFVQIATPTTTTFNDTGLTASTSYSYRVRANDAAGNNSAYSNTASATTQTPPDTTPPTAPTNLTATAASTTQINLSWTASTDNVGVAGYLVERCSGAACANFVQIATPTGTTFNDTGLTASTSYSYRVRADDAAGNDSAYSNTASATTQTPPDTTPPTAPTNLTATAASTSQINLTWTASTDNVGVTGYKVERCSGAACANFVQIATPTTTTFNDTGLTASTSYSYRVRANDAAGNNSAYSNTASATTQASSGNISVTISPVRGGLTISQTMPFTATVTNDVGSAGVTWSASSGSFSAQSTSTATFVAPSSAGVVTVTATSVADVTKSASATIGVTDLAGVFTYHNDLSRDGVNAQEYALTTNNVTTASFGKLFSCTTDSPIYAQPLWVANLTIQGGKHNVIFAATVHDTVYAFDADANPCVTYWSSSLLGSGETYVSYNDVNSTDIDPDIGIIGTPVIDPSSNTFYVVSKSKTSGSNCTPATSCFQRLHALSLTDGSEKFGGPANITSAISVPGTGDGSSGGSVAFNTLTENQRPGLVLSNGVVYVAWASHGDNPPYHGWVIGFSASTLAITGTFNANPNGSDTGIWMSGGAPSADSSGNLYFLTGNGTFDANSGGSDYGDSTVKLSTSGGMSVASYFTPADQASLEGSDVDHGAGGAAILVDQPVGAPFQHLVIGGGKEGNMFLLNRDNLAGYGGNFTPSDSNSVQKFSVGNGIFATAAFFNNALYIAGGGGHLKSFAFNTTTGQFNTAQTSQSPASFGWPGATPSVSAWGTTNAIIWAMNNNAFCTGSASTCGPAVLHAYDATNLATELWNSGQTSGDHAGNAVKFTVPTVANGKVYLGTRGDNTGSSGATVPGEVDVYGLKPN